ncbi:hypothetical protein ACLOJK_022590, partial [Asimina triloba]
DCCPRWKMGLDLGGGVGQALLAVDELLSPARWAKGATLLMGRSWPSSSSLPADGFGHCWPSDGEMGFNPSGSAAGG